MKAIIAVIGVGSAVLLLFLLAEVLNGTADVWEMVKAAPRQFFHYISSSFSHDMLWTAAVVIGVVIVIAFVRRVPDANTR